MYSLILLDSETILKQRIFSHTAYGFQRNQKRKRNRPKHHKQAKTERCSYLSTDLVCPSISNYTFKLPAISTSFGNMLYIERTFSIFSIIHSHLKIVRVYRKDNSFEQFTKIRSRMFTLRFRGLRRRREQENRNY